MTKFQIIVLGIFIVFIIIGVAAFATFKGGSSSSSLPTITVWGTFPADTFNKYVSQISLTLPQALTVTYRQESPQQFPQDFVAALARGIGPDAILIPSDMILPEENKLVTIPYATLPQRTFLDTYIQEADIYDTGSGFMAVPFTVDPLVMYWNRDMFNSAGVAAYPRYWNDLTSLNSKLTAKHANGNIRTSAVALGDFTNVDNAREILGSMFMQVGNAITSLDNRGNVVSALQSSSGAGADVTPALQFFTQFVDPTNENYSWNRSMPDSKTAFLSGTLATYFGFASELADIKAKNPNLNFDVAPLPQLQTGGIKADYARMYGFSIVRASANANAAYQIISILTEPAYLSTLSQTMYLPPVRTDLVAAGSSDQYITIFDKAALIGKTWLDSDPAQSSQIFGNLVNAVTSGQASLVQAIQNASNQYSAVLQQATQ